jgi:hypothetical protein
MVHYNIVTNLAVLMTILYVSKIAIVTLQTSCIVVLMSVTNNTQQWRVYTVHVTTAARDNNGLCKVGGDSIETQPKMRTGGAVVCRGNNGGWRKEKKRRLNL